MSQAFFSPAVIEKIETKSMELNAERKQRRKMKNAFVEFVGHETISQFNRTCDLKVHKGEGLSIDEDIFAAKYLFSAADEKNLVAFNTATNKIEATHTFTHKLIEVLVYNDSHAEDASVSLLVSDKDKRLHSVVFNTETKKFSVQFDHQFDEIVHKLLVHPIGSLLIGLKSDRSWFVFNLTEVIGVNSIEENCL